MAQHLGGAGPGQGPVVVVVGHRRSPCPQPSDAEASEGGEQEERERLRKVLKQMGRLRCPQEVSGGHGSVGWGGPAGHSPTLWPDPQGCGAAFSSLMGYQYHQRRCGKPPCEVDSPSFPCTHCGKTYRSKAGHDYHVRSEHTAPVSGSPFCGIRSVAPCLLLFAVCVLCASGTNRICPCAA